jgi:hypothetical protein
VEPQEQLEEWELTPLLLVAQPLQQMVVVLVAHLLLLMVVMVALAVGHT